MLCTCGKEHHSAVKEIIAERGAITRLPEILARYRLKKPFVYSDPDTYIAAGGQVEDVLQKAGIGYSRFTFSTHSPKPDEETVGSIIEHFDTACDCVIGIGSGVMNDVGKILSSVSGRFFIIVGTAPSMDGYASNSSSMERDGLKTTLYSKCPDIIVGDLDILAKAPMRMMISGVGDMIAKYVSVCEWRISHIVNNEYYCETVADMMRSALKKIVSSIDGFLRRDPDAVREVFLGLIMGGVAMQYANTSRPASGTEHYFSHIWDMRSLAFGTKADFHGIQCAVGTFYAVRLYEELLKIPPDREKAIAYATSFDYSVWQKTLRSVIGPGAETMIALEEKEGKYDPEKHRIRLEKILTRWDEIRAIIREELPSSAELEALYRKLGLPLTAGEIGTDTADLKTVFYLTKDIRDKYILSHLSYDLGIREEIAEKVF